jgi:transcriptional regulator of acetoin/glycerol metabolism
LYVDKRKFLQSLQVSSEQDVVVLLTDRAGRVVWRSGGPVTDSKKADFQTFLAKAEPR